MRTEAELRELQKILADMTANPEASPDRESYLAVFIANEVLSWCLDMPVASGVGNFIRACKSVADVLRRRRQARTN